MVPIAFARDNARGIFGESTASCGRVANVIPVDVTVAGCPPPPLAILRAILQAVAVPTR